MRPIDINGPGEKADTLKRYVQFRYFLSTEWVKRLSSHMNMIPLYKMLPPTDQTLQSIRHHKAVI